MAFCYMVEENSLISLSFLSEYTCSNVLMVRCTGIAQINKWLFSYIHNLAISQYNLSILLKLSLLSTLQAQH